MADDISTPLRPLSSLFTAEMKAANSADEFLAGIFSAESQYGDPSGSTWIITLRLYVDRRFPSVILKGLPALTHLKGLVSRNQVFIGQLLFQINFYGKQGFSGLSVATRLAESVLTVAIKDFLDNSSWRKAEATLGLRDPFLSKILGDIHKRPEADWSIHVLAEKAGLSRSAFINRFKNVVGQTPNDFITSLRMMKASELLESTHLPIYQVAVDVGYGSEASFTRAFQRWSGVTPGALRARSRERK